MQRRKLVVQILDFDSLISIFVDLIQEYMGPAALYESIDQIEQAIVRKPDIVQTHIEGSFSICRKGLFDVLQHEGGLSTPSRPFDTNKACIPGDADLQIADQTHIGVL